MTSELEIAYYLIRCIIFQFYNLNSEDSVKSSFNKFICLFMITFGVFNAQNSLCYGKFSKITKKETPSTIEYQGEEKVEGNWPATLKYTTIMYMPTGKASKPTYDGRRTGPGSFVIDLNMFEAQDVFKHLKDEYEKQQQGL